MGKFRDWTSREHEEHWTKGKLRAFMKRKPLCKTSCAIAQHKQKPAKNIGMGTIRTLSFRR